MEKIDKRIIKEIGKRPNPKDYNDFIDWFDDVDRWERKAKKLQTQLNKLDKESHN